MNSCLSKVSVIILNFNGLKDTINCIKSVLKSNYFNFEIIIVDNGSSANEVLMLNNIFGKSIKIIFSKTNLGYAGGCNLGVNYATGEYLVFLNNDTIVPKNWLENPINRLEEDKKIAFIQPKIKSLVFPGFFEYAGGAGGYIDFFGYPFVRGRIFGTLEQDIGQYDDEREIFWASGVCLFCRKIVFQKLGGFDPLFFAYAEEDDLCFRAIRAGFRNIYFPNVEIYHYGGKTSNRNIPYKLFLIHRNHIILLIKNVKLIELIIILPIRFLFDLFTSVYYLFIYKSIINSLVVFRSYSSLMFNIFRIIKTRQNYRIANFGLPYNRGILYKGSIVIDYFILQRRTWSEVILNKKIHVKLNKIF
jgi:GT2 family glycosyltransferase